MANIHHATIKSAKVKGVILEVLDSGATVTATKGERTFELPVEYEGDEATQSELTERAKDAWTALDDALAFEADHPSFQIETDGGDFVGILVADGEEVARDPELADLFETLREIAAGDAEDEGDEDEERETRSIVPPTYKAQYAAMGHPAHCGDWLAIVLNERCLDDKGKAMIEPMLLICEANGVDAARYMAKQSKGWEGRFRMTSRNVLAKVVAKAGVLHIPAEANKGNGDVELTPPAEWIADHMPKAKGKAAVQA